MFDRWVYKSPNGAFETKTTIYYIDGKFHDEIPEDYIFKTWGYRIVDPLELNILTEPKFRYHIYERVRSGVRYIDN